ASTAITSSRGFEPWDDFSDPPQPAMSTTSAAQATAALSTAATLAGHGLPVGHHHDPVGECTDEALVVLDDEQRDAALPDRREDLQQAVHLGPPSPPRGLA